MSDPSRRALTVTEARDAALAMILVRRGAAADTSRALQARFGVGLPAPGRLIVAGADVVLWQGPDRFLAVRESGGGGLARELTPVLAGVAHVVDASSARVILTVTGEGVADALSRLLPIDLHPRVFVAGSVALTIAGHIDVQVWCQDDAEAFRIACTSSLARSFRRQLAEAGIGEMQHERG